MKMIHILGGGTRSHIDSHLFLGSKGSGKTAIHLCELFEDAVQSGEDGEFGPVMNVRLHLTNSANPASGPDTPEDVERLLQDIVGDPSTKIVVFNVAVVDFSLDAGKEGSPREGRISSQRVHLGTLIPTPKLVHSIRKERKDIFLVAFKQTWGASEEEQYREGLNLLKSASCNLVLANDAKTRTNMIIVPEEAAYCVTTDRERALRELVEMTLLRSHLTFTRSTVIDGEPVPWDSELVPPSLRTIVDYCIEKGAYKRFRGVTAGHFAVKLSDTEFLTSRRKTDFNDMKNVGLVRVKTDGPDTVLAYGSRPSVGGQSQRIVFDEHPDADCVVHFHCVKKEGSAVPVVSQREFECGSHQCGSNTSKGLIRFGSHRGDADPILAVYLDNHGPNIVFHHSIDPQEVIDFIEQNFDLTTKSGGYQL